MARARAIKETEPRIACSAEVRGGAPVIAGTGIRVIDIAIRYEVMGMSPEEILGALPHLTLAQVHAALAHYYAHKPELDRQWKSSLRRASKQRKGSVSVLESLIGPSANLSR